jgi:hypothetical protein
MRCSTLPPGAPVALPAAGGPSQQRMLGALTESSFRAKPPLCLRAAIVMAQIGDCTQGEHPKHKGISEPARLGTVERYFVEIMDIPRLQQRIQCFVFARTFSATVQRVCPRPCLHACTFPCQAKACS